VTAAPVLGVVVGRHCANAGLAPDRATKNPVAAARQGRGRSRNAGFPVFLRGSKGLIQRSVVLTLAVRVPAAQHALLVQSSKAIVR
jgi:hypothetical protein